MWNGIGKEPLCGEDVGHGLLADAPSLRTSLSPAQQCHCLRENRALSLPVHPLITLVSKVSDVELVPFFDAHPFELGEVKEGPIILSLKRSLE